MQINRRTFILAGAPFAAGCAKRRGTGYPGHAFVANADSRSVAVVDLSAFRVARQIPFDGSPGSVLADRRKPVVYVLVPERATVHEIDSRKFALARRVKAGGAAVTMRMSDDGRSMWVLCRDPRSLARIDLETFRVTGRIKLPALPVDLDIMKQLSAVSFGGEHPPLIVNLGSAAIEREVDAGEEPLIVRFRSDGAQVLASNYAARTVTVADVATGKIVVRLPVGLQPAQFCFKADGGQLFVTGPGLDAVAVIQPYQTEVAETLLAGHAPGAMAVSWKAPEYLFVANPDSGDVTVLDTLSRRVLAAVSVGEEPAGILVTPDNQYALVLNRRSGDLAVIRVASIMGSRSKNVPHTRTAPLFTMIPVGSKPVSAAVQAS